MLGFYGRILTINLTDQSFEVESLPGVIYEQVLGGKGLATHLLLTKNAPGADPLSPENHLMFATGPVCQSAFDFLPRSTNDPGKQYLSLS